MNITWKRLTGIGVIMTQHLQPGHHLVTHRLLRRNVNMRGERMMRIPRPGPILKPEFAGIAQTREK